MRTTVVYIVEFKVCRHGAPWDGNKCSWRAASTPCRRELIAAQRDDSVDYVDADSFDIVGSDCSVHLDEINVLREIPVRVPDGR